MEREPIRDLVDILEKKSTHDYKIGEFEIRFNKSKQRADIFNGDIKVGHLCWKEDDYFQINDKGTVHQYDYYDNFFGVVFDIWTSPIAAIMMDFMRGVI